MKAPFAFVILSLAFSMNAFGLGMELRSPEIGCPADLDKREQDTVRRVVEFMHEDLTFIKGSFVNEFSTQRFGGTPAQVSAFLVLLKGAGLWKVQVVFRDFGEQDSAFILSQSSPGSVTVVINAGREDFRLKDFQAFLPGAATPVALPPRPEQADAPTESDPAGVQKVQPKPEGASR